MSSLETNYYTCLRLLSRDKLNHLKICQTECHTSEEVVNVLFFVHGNCEVIFWNGWEFRAFVIPSNVIANHSKSMLVGSE